MNRTVCDCRACTICCEHMPGYLIPRDLPALAAIVPDLAEHLLASPGALVGDSRTGSTFRIPTIVPARKADGSCVFLERGRCTVHAVAPFGCAFFDAHMTGREGDRRSMIGLRLIAEDLAAPSSEYGTAHADLMARGRHAPSPETSRRALRSAADREGIPS